jgi:sigma-E factor negative regulatory protein RseA
MTDLNAVRRNAPEADIHPDDWLSALYDGELDDEVSKQRLLSLGKETEAARRWSEYSLIGDVLRGCPIGQDGLGKRISAALAEEPTVLAPMPAAASAPRRYYWAAAAATVAVMAWGVLSLSPGGEPAYPVAASDSVAHGQATSMEGVNAYLAAHQDYAYAVSGESDMHVVKVSLVGANR